MTKYAEPMVGGGALFFSILSKYDFEELYISDINAELINAYQAVKNDVDNLIAKLNEMQMLFYLWMKTAENISTIPFVKDSIQRH